MLLASRYGHPHVVKVLVEEYNVDVFHKKPVCVHVCVVCACVCGVCMCVVCVHVCGVCARTCVCACTLPLLLALHNKFLVRTF